MNRQNINILVVDDEESVLAAVCGILRACGYNVKACSKPEDALDYAENNVVHIALVDFSMPNIDGISFVSMIREISSLTQIIMMCAYATSDRIVAAIENGACDFILKPFINPDAVASVVEVSERKLERLQGVLRELGVL